MFAPVGALWRRGHKPIKKYGTAFIIALKEYIDKMSGTILTDSPVKEFLLEEGEIKGVIATGVNGQKITVRARAVVLASGGFGANTKMLKQYNTYWSYIADDIKTTNSYAMTGDGIDEVTLGQCIARPNADALGVAIHASLSGRVTRVDSHSITISRAGAAH